MRKSNLLLAGALAAAAVLVAPAADAAVAVQVIGVGSSAIFNTATIGAFALAGPGALHYTTKGTCAADGLNCAQIVDSRVAGILPEGGNLSVVWNAGLTEVWAYLSVDSVVGNRAFFAVPRTQLQLDAENLNPGNAQNLVAASLLGNTVDQTELPPAIYDALNNTPITAGFTDIRPEDAKFASDRVLAALGAVVGNNLNSPNYGFGYGPGPIGTPIKSAFSSSQANPVDFNIMGTDPITGQPVPSFKTVSIGATPVLIVINRSNPSGLGTPGIGHNTGVGNLLDVFEGRGPAVVYTGVTTPASRFSGCQANILITGAPSVPLNVVQREPLSGTMNTFEFTVMNTSVLAGSQEQDVVTNPLSQGCGSNQAGPGTRKRAIGTGEVIKNGILPVADSVGYAFFSFGNVSPIAGSTSYGYLTLNGIDPINTTYSTGVLPTCSNPCPVPDGTSFPNLRNGKYRSWSVLRAVTDSNNTNVQTLVNNIEKLVNSTVPDFVPFNFQSNTEPGLRLYRSHYLQSGVAPNNGLTNPALESGGDVGGCIEKKVVGAGVLGCDQ